MCTHVYENVCAFSPHVTVRVRHSLCFSCFAYMLEMFHIREVHVCICISALMDTFAYMQILHMCVGVGASSLNTIPSEESWFVVILVSSKLWKFSYLK